jgi:hypothetical protein
VELRVLRRDGEGRGGVEPAEKADWPRPELTVIQGGAPRRVRSRSRAMRMALEAPPAEQLAEVEEIPVYLRPIPSWVPRLW